MNQIISILAVIALLLGLGLLAGLADWKNFAPKWLLIAALLVATEDALLTNMYGSLTFRAPGDWNWLGKGLALVAMLAVAALPAFGWRRVGLTFRQERGSLVWCLPVVGLYLAFFFAIALFTPNATADVETIAFQLTMPGLEEELFYRGVLLFALGEAFRGKVRLLGVDWGWDAVLSSTLFGLTHAFGFSDSAFTFDPMYFALTFVPSFLGVWLREKSGSLCLPILVHNAGNSLSLLL